MKQLVVIFTLWLAWMPVGAQKTLTLEECLKLGSSDISRDTAVV